METLVWAVKLEERKRLLPAAGNNSGSWPGFYLFYKGKRKEKKKRNKATEWRGVCPSAYHESPTFVLRLLLSF